MHVLIDNTVLANFVDIVDFDVFFFIRKKQIFSKVVVPEAVKMEFANCPDYRKSIKRERLLTFMEEEGPDYYELCTTYDPVILDILKTEKNIHEGEAAIIAQALPRGFTTILTDDTHFINLLEDQYSSQINHYNSCVIIALLDINSAFSSCKKFVLFIQGCRSNFLFKKTKLKKAYETAYMIMGLAVDKKHIKQRLYVDLKEVF